MEKDVTLFSTIINDYDQLRNDYEEYCNDNDIEPIDGNEIDWFYEDLWDICWPDFKYEIKRLDEKFSYYLCVGSFGLWNGRQEGGFVSDSIFDAIEKCTKSCDDFEITACTDGTINVTGYHHDGQNSFTIYALNKRAGKVIDKYYDLIANRELNEKLSKQYYQAKIVYGVDVY